MFKYPYGDSQQLNLDWILRKLKELEGAIGQQITEDLEVISNALISATFSSSNAYNRSDIVYHDGKLYRANVNIPAPGESWNPAHWDEIMLGDTVANLVRYVGSLSNNQVFNSSTVPGTHTSDALDNLKSDITQIDNQINTIQPEVDKIQQITDVFDFYNPNAAYRIANNQGEARVGYTFNADNTITVNKNYSAYGSAYAFNDSLMLKPGKYNLTAYVQTNNASPSLSYPVRVKLGLSSDAAQYPDLTTTQGGTTPISTGDNAGWLSAEFEITEEETFCFLIMPNSTAWDPLTISHLAITGITAYDAEARTDINNLNGAITNGTLLDGMPQTGKKIPANSNLNDYTTAGTYWVQSDSDAATIANMPRAASGTLYVINRARGGYKTQIYFPTTSIQIYYTRNYNNGTWTDWIVKSDSNSNIANVELTNTATQAYSKGDFVIVNGVLQKAITSISNGDSFTSGTNITPDVAMNVIKSMGTHKTFTAKLYDYDTYIRDIPNQWYWKIGELIIVLIETTWNHNDDIQTMVEIRDLPCNVVSGVCYIANLSGTTYGADRTIQGSGQWAYIRPNLKSSEMNNTDGVFQMLIFGYERNGYPYPD